MLDIGDYISWSSNSDEDIVDACLRNRRERERGRGREREREGWGWGR